MSTEPQVLTLSHAARRAAEIVDPDGDDALVGEWLERFEDRDEPITAIDEPDERLLRLALDAELTDPPETVRDWITDAGLPDPK